MRSDFRLWWHRPKLHEAGEDARRVTFLELFFDLIFVVVIARLAHHLTAYPDAGGLRDFVLLFIPVWWVWVGITFYNERFETYDLSFRFFTLLHLLAIGGMAASAEYGLGKTAAAFALWYAAARAVTTFMWWRAGRHNPQLRPITDVYTLGFSISIVLWVISAFLGASALAILLRAVGLLIDLSMPWVTMRHQRRLLTASARKLPERFGLFVIVVLGESLVGVVNGLADVGQGDAVTVLRFGLGVLLGFGLWWVYFDYIGRREPRAHTRALAVWTYLHLPLMAGITMVGAMTTHGVTLGEDGAGAGVRLILGLGFALFYLAVAALDFVVEEEALLDRRRLTALRLGTALAALLLAALPLPLAALTLLLVALHALHMALGVRAWFRSDNAGRVDVH